MPHAHRLRSKPLNEESADAGLDSVAIDRALLVSESVHRESCPLRWADLSWKVSPANHSFARLSWLRLER